MAISVPHSGSSGDAEVDQSRLRTVDAVIGGVQGFVQTEPSTRASGRLQRRIHESLTAPGHGGRDDMGAVTLCPMTPQVRWSRPLV